MSEIAVPPKRFAVAPLNIRNSMTHRFSRPTLIALVAALAFGAVKLVLTSAGLKALAVSGEPMPGAMTLQKVGTTLFAEHLLGFEVAGILLLAAMVGAVALTKRNL